jgi:hypothetical protein
MLTGSLASAYYGTPRATQDIDLVVDPGERWVSELNLRESWSEIVARLGVLPSGDQQRE